VALERQEMFKQIINEEQLIEYTKRIGYIIDDEVRGKWCRLKKVNGPSVIIYYDISILKSGHFARNSCFAFLPPCANGTTVTTFSWFFIYEEKITSLLLDEENKILIAPESGTAFSL